MGGWVGEAILPLTHVGCFRFGVMNSVSTHSGSCLLVNIVHISLAHTYLGGALMTHRTCACSAERKC